MKQEFVVRCRAVILHDGKLLTVRHVNKDFLALPGGHVEFGEDPKACLRREIIEELGIEPVIGRLVCVNTFTFQVGEVAKQPVEFFFMVENTADYLTLAHVHRSHAHEIAEYVWLLPTDERQLLPERFAAAFRAGTISGEVLFLQD